MEQLDDEYMEKFSEWEKINSAHHKEYLDKVKSIKKDRMLSKLGKDEKLKELQKERMKVFFEIRMKYLGH